KAILISSHILAEMTEFCTSIAIMQKGRMVVSGRIDEIREQVMGGSTLSVEVLGNGDAAALRRVVGEDHRAGSVAELPGRFEFRYQGDAEAASELLGRLVSGGVRVVSFARRKEGLEELFLKIGAREVS
ncbi:MAG TPA: DUF4162 domain-containing protein, partial [Isosphaeraceae bacterium]|nr:DUF4162 domain-containing protein [Isosphaeraceae bacterium]